MSAGAGKSPPEFSSRLYVGLSPADIAFFKFILEAHDNLAYLSVVDKYSAVGRITFSPDQRDEVLEFLDIAGRELELRILDPTF